MRRRFVFEAIVAEGRGGDGRGGAGRDLLWSSTHVGRLFIVFIFEGWVLCVVALVDMGDFLYVLLFCSFVECHTMQCLVQYKSLLKLEFRETRPVPVIIRHTAKNDRVTSWWRPSHEHARPKKKRQNPR